VRVTSVVRKTAILSRPAVSRTATGGRSRGVEEMIRRDFQLILKRASASRPSGEWSEDDYDVLADGSAASREPLPRW